MVERLGKNVGRYQGEAIPIWDLLSEIAELAGSDGWTQELFFGEQFPLFAYHRPANVAGAKRIYLSSGIHGDEPSGPLCIRELLSSHLIPLNLDVTLVPCLNPRGFELNTRENERGIDLNREYRNPRAAEVVWHIEWLRKQESFDLGLLLHEDWEASGFYLYELNPNGHPSLGEALVETAATTCPIERSNLVDNWAADRGIIRPEVKPVDRPEWAEALWLIENKSLQNYTLETPSDYPLELRVRTHTAVTVRALEIFSAQPTGDGRQSNSAGAFPGPS